MAASHLDMDLDLPVRRKKSKWSKYFPAFLAWFFILAASTLYFLFPGKALADHADWHPYSIAIPTLQAVILLFLLANLTVATFMDPGFLPKAPADEIPKDDFRSPLYKTVDIKGVPVRLKWCITCNLYRPPRTSHCSTCDRCIEVFDHHCPWVANCVGRRNYRFFLYFLISLTLLMLTVFAASLHHVIVHHETIPDPVNIISIILMVFIGLLIFPVGGLMCFHFHLVVNANTTNEQVTAKFRGGKNPYDRGCIRNCLWTFCGPRFQKYNELTHEHYTPVAQSATHAPFSPSASPTQVRIEMPDRSLNHVDDPVLKFEGAQNTLRRQYNFKPAASPPYENEKSSAAAALPSVPSSNSPVTSYPASYPNPICPSSALLNSQPAKSHNEIKSKMQPVIAELAARTTSASVSSADGYYSSTSSPPPIRFSQNLRSTCSDHKSPNKPQEFTRTSENPRISLDPRFPAEISRSSSRQDSGASTASTTDKNSLDAQRMFRAVDGRLVNSPRHLTRKTRAYGNMLREDIRSCRDENSSCLLTSKAVSTSNLASDTSLALYRKNPTLVGSQPSLTVLERSRKPRPPSFVQALETTDSIEQLSLLGRGSVHLKDRDALRKEKMKAFGEISV